MFPNLPIEQSYCTQRTKKANEHHKHRVGCTGGPVNETLTLPGVVAIFRPAKQRRQAQEPRKNPHAHDIHSASGLGKVQVISPPVDDEVVAVHAHHR